MAQRLNVSVHILMRPNVLLILMAGHAHVHDGCMLCTTSKLLWHHVLVRTLGHAASSIQAMLGLLCFLLPPYFFRNLRIDVWARVDHPCVGCDRDCCQGETHRPRRDAHPGKQAHVV